MPVYNPTDANFLSVAQTRTNNGQKDVRVILDISTNIFYTLDDDGNFIEIQSSGGGQDLAGTLAIGNETGGTPITINKGDYITGEENFDLTLKIEDTTTNYEGGFVIDSSGSYMTNTIYAKDLATGDTTKIFCDLTEAKFISPNGSILQVSDSGGLNYNKSWNNVLFTSTAGMTNGISLYERSYGSITEFKTTGNTATLLVKTPSIGGNVSYIEVVVKGWYEQASPGTTRKGFVKKMAAAARKNSSFQLVQLGTTQTIFSGSDFSTADATLTASGTFFQVDVTGEAATDIYWNAHILVHNI
jgi:hypothetical protein